MHKLDDFKVFVMFSVAAFLVPIAYYLKDRASPESYLAQISPDVAFVGATILFVFGATTARFLASILLKFKWVRRKILKSAYVEGYWLLKTEPQGDSKGMLDKLGIAFMSYRLDCREFKIETTRYEGKRKIVTQSEVGYVRSTGSTVRYLNFFKTTYPNPDGPSGFASGRFAYGDHFSEVPQYFDAVIAVQGGEYLGSQHAERIPDDVAKKYYEDHGTEWMKFYIEKHDVIERSHKSNVAEKLAEVKSSPKSADRRRKIAEAKQI